MSSRIERFTHRLDEARAYAKGCGWAEVDHQRNIGMVSFRRGPERLNYYYGRGTVATIVDHPLHGRNQMFRKGVFGPDLARIFKKPRAHLKGKGIEGYHQNGVHIHKIKRRKNHENRLCKSKKSG